MAFPRAIQKANPEAFAEFIQAKLVHSEETKLYYRQRKLYQNATEPELRLKWFEAKEAFSMACKRIHAAKEKYERIQAMSKLKEKGIDISTLTLKAIAEISVATSIKDIMDQARQENKKEAILLDPAAQKLIKQLQTPEIISMKEQFMRDMEDKPDSTLDDAPLSITDEELN